MTTITTATDSIPVNHPRVLLRNTSKEEFIEKWGSGTLRKSHRLGFDTHDAYLQERIRFEFGIAFEIIQRSRVTYSDIKLISSQALTELGWHAERMIELRPFDSDEFVCKQFDIEYANGTIKQGAGILLKSTSASWIPNGYMVFAIITEKRNNQYLPAINPF